MYATTVITDSTVSELVTIGREEDGTKGHTYSESGNHKVPLVGQQRGMDIRRLVAYDAIILTAGIWFFAKFFRYSLPPLFNSFQVNYGVSNAGVGIAFTGFMLAYAVMQFPSGAIADRHGSVPVISAGALVAALAAIGLFFGNSFVLLASLMILIGLGTGVHKTVAIRLLSNLYPSQTGRALGVLDTVGSFGGVVAPAAVSALLVLTGNWRWIFLSGGVCALAVTSVFFTRVEREGPVSTSRSQNSYWSFFEPFKDRQFFTFALATVFYAFTYNGAVTFIPLYLTREFGVSPAAAGIIYGGFFVASLVQLVSGETADKIGTLRVIMGCLLIATVTLSFMTLLPSDIAAGSAGGLLIVSFGVIGFGIGTHGYRPVRDAHIVDLIPDSTTGGTLGVVRAVLTIGGVFSPALVGVVADLVGFRAAFGILAVSLGICTVMTAWTGRQTGAD